MGFRTYKGNKNSENGWPIVDNDEIEKRFLPGMNNVRLECRKGDVMDVLAAWCIWYHKNVEVLDKFQPRDEWGFSWDNLVANSNHLSGTALDLNATQWPWKTYRMPQWMVDKINEGLRLFEGNIFHGRNWGTPDEMHFQINGYNPDKLAAFNGKLKQGYLGIYAPADPNAFPLPVGYAFGPLEGPEWSISGSYSGDLPAWKEALGRWQAEAGLVVTKKWDVQTAGAVQKIQEERGWWNDENRMKGYLYTGEWEAVIKQDWNAPQVAVPDFPPAPVVEEQAGVYFADVSQWQPHVDDSYPFKVLSVRSNSGDKVDTKIARNLDWSLKALDEGKLECLIVYYFFRPGQSNCDLWKTLVTRNGKIHPKIVCMVDVEGDKGSVRGDVSAEVNDEVDRIRGWLGDPRRVIGYWNPTADPGLWKTLPGKNFRMVVPWYNNDISRSPSFPGLLAHQYSDKVPCAPFGPCDANFSNLRLSQFLVAVGLQEVATQPGEVTWAHVMKELVGV